MKKSTGVTGGLFHSKEAPGEKSHGAVFIINYVDSAKAAVLYLRRG